MQQASQFRRAFTIVELMVVIAIITVMAGLALPAVNSFKSNELSSAARTVSNMLTVARTEAITQNTVTRFAVSTDWQDQTDSNYRKISVWKQKTTGAWEQIGKWETIPQGVVFDPQYSSLHDVGNSGSANYLLLTTGSNDFPMTVGGKTVAAKFVEFTPSGAARTADPNAGPDIWMALVPGYITSGSTVMTTGPKKSGVTSNYAKVSTNVLTGRIKIARP